MIAINVHYVTHKIPERMCITKMQYQVNITKEQTKRLKLVIHLDIFLENNNKHIEDCRIWGAVCYNIVKGNDYD